MGQALKQLRPGNAFEAFERVDSAPGVPKTAFLSLRAGLMGPRSKAEDEGTAIGSHMSPVDPQGAVVLSVQTHQM